MLHAAVKSDFTLEQCKSPQVFNFMASRIPEFKIPQFADYHNFKDWSARTNSSILNESASTNDLISTKSEISAMGLGFSLRHKYQSLGLVSVKNQPVVIDSQDGPNNFKPLLGVAKPAGVSKKTTHLKGKLRSLESLPTSLISSANSPVERTIVAQKAAPLQFAPQEKIIFARKTHPTYSTGDLFSCDPSSEQVEIDRVASLHRMNDYTVKRIKLDRTNLPESQGDEYTAIGMYDKANSDATEKSVLSVFDETYNKPCHKKSSNSEKKSNRIKTIQFQVMQ